MMFRATVLLAASIALVSACTADQPPADESPDATSAMPGMPTMGMGQSAAMMRDMTVHIEMMQQISADSVAAILPAHRQQVANMIAQMNREMRDMDMAADTAWEAVLDSLRGDLIHMPDMSPDELQQLMSQHAARVTRLMDMHKRMMETMHR